jgi:hypothetical protein
MKYVVAGITFVFIWLAASFLIGLIMLVIIRPDHPVVVGIGFDWINLPGTILGFIAGLHSAKASIRAANKKSSKKNSEEIKQLNK